MISVIIPVHKPSPNLSIVRKQLQKHADNIEVIIVTDPSLIGSIGKEYIGEQIHAASQIGRGFACYEGLFYASGNIVVILHADTVLPENWLERIVSNMTSTNVSGGAFSLAFDRSTRYLGFLIFLSDLLFKLNGELWGDRAVFFRRKLLIDNPEVLQVPIMEDVRLSLFLKRKGKTIMLKEKVITSSATFFGYGAFWNTVRIIICRTWYALGGNPQQIYKFYYSKNLSESKHT